MGTEITAALLVLKGLIEAANVIGGNVARAIAENRDLTPEEAKANHDARKASLAEFNAEFPKQ